MKWTTGFIISILIFVLSILSILAGCIFSSSLFVEYRNVSIIIVITGIALLIFSISCMLKLKHKIDYYINYGIMVTNAVGSFEKILQDCLDYTANKASYKLKKEIEWQSQELLGKINIKDKGKYE